MEVSKYIRYTPVGEYVRLLVLKRLARGPAEVEEIDNGRGSRQAATREIRLAGVA